MRDAVALTSVLALSSVALAANFSLVADYSGNGFFDEWTFYGNYDNLTNGASPLPRYPGPATVFLTSL